MGAIDEHKELITEEYKNIKRELDIERGNFKSQVKLAKKEKRSEKTIEQREKAVSIKDQVLAGQSVSSMLLAAKVLVASCG